MSAVVEVRFPGQAQLLVAGSSAVVGTAEPRQIRGPEPTTLLVMAESPARSIEVGGTPVRLLTTKPLPIIDGALTLPSMPLGDVVFSKAQVYLDLTSDDFDSEGNLLGTRDYLVDDCLVRTYSNRVVFTSPIENDLHAVVSYLTTAYD